VRYRFEGFLFGGYKISLCSAGLRNGGTLLLCLSSVHVIVFVSMPIFVGFFSC
jgi:hypothetical protein